MDILDRITMLLGNREQKELTNYLKLNSVALSLIHISEPTRP